MAIRAAQVSCLSSVPSTVKLDQLDRQLFSPSGIQSLIFFSSQDLQANCCAIKRSCHSGGDEMLLLV